MQPSLATSVHKVQQRDDVFLLPPPDQLRAMTLGYRAGAADLLWTKLILEYGIHWQEKRAFPEVTRYVDGILAVEPDFKTVYEFVDTLLLFAPGGATPERAREARAYLERGTRERPYDATVWLHYGQFIAFLAPSFLKDKAEIERWRIDGAAALTRAVELGADAQRSLAASTILSKAGERKASVEHLQRAYAMTDDPDTREQILLKLRMLEATAEAADATSVVDREWHGRFDFVSRSAALLIGPARSPAKCAGPASYDTPGCSRDWAGVIAERR
ncbi:hypothetical protein [Labilithrix luteola]|uniref:hypothetical protein n=1 Tax=Labilithrix luteola TaxID=1391654 RepID=UPI0011BACAF2|nr:hypothetical protein [Labilithrix luteola]